jgi:hypothetical protein
VLALRADHMLKLLKRHRVLSAPNARARHGVTFVGWRADHAAWIYARAEHFILEGKSYRTNAS